MALHTNNVTRFIAYPNYTLWFLDGYFPKKQNLEIDFLQVRKGGLNFKENWLCFYISLIDKGSQFYAEFLPKMY